MLVLRGVVVSFQAGAEKREDTACRETERRQQQMKRRKRKRTGVLLFVPRGSFFGIWERNPVALMSHVALLVGRVDKWLGVA